MFSRVSESVRILRELPEFIRMYGSSKAAPPYWKNDCEQMDDCGVHHRICNSGGPNSSDECSDPTER